MEYFLFLGVAGISILLALAFALSIPILFVFLGLSVTKKLTPRLGRVPAYVLFSLFLTGPVLYWFHEWNTFKDRCQSASRPRISIVYSKVNGLAFDSGYPHGLLKRYFGGGSSSSSRFEFAESKRLEKNFLGEPVKDKTISRSSVSKGYENVDEMRSEFIVKGGDASPVNSAITSSQYESKLQVVRLSNNEVVAERHVLLFGGGITSLLLAFSTGSSYVACEAGDPKTFPWLTRQKTSAEVDHHNALVKKDVNFIHSVVWYQAP